LRAPEHAEHVNADDFAVTALIPSKLHPTFKIAALLGERLWPFVCLMKRQHMVCPVFVFQNTFFNFWNL
jgi:hypothetical protein